MATTLKKTTHNTFQNGNFGKKVSRGHPGDPDDSECIRFVPIRPAQLAAIKDRQTDRQTDKQTDRHTDTFSRL